MATGSRPTHFPGVPFDGPDVYDPDPVYSLRTVREDIVVVGAGRYEPQGDHPVVIELHISGVRSKEMNPNTPISYDEIAEDAIRCWEAPRPMS